MSGEKGWGQGRESARFYSSPSHHIITPPDHHPQQLEQNLKFDFSMTTEDGKSMKPVFGPKLTGMKNIGNR